MSNTNCVANSSSIEYDLSKLTLDITGKGAFEAVFLNSVLDKLRGTCIGEDRVFIKQQCKSLYPDVNSKNWCRWLTSVDQENRISLTHTLERGKVPILYNTPRMCDPGISMSKNWSLRNYIESRLYLFRYVYGYGKGYVQNSNGSGNCGNNKVKNGSSCYPSVVFDFRPYRYILKMGDKRLWVTQWITVPDPRSKEKTPAAGFVPHSALTTYPHKPSLPNNSSKVSRGVFKSLVEAVIRGKNLGNDPKSLLNSKYELGAAGSGINSNNLYIDTFIDFIEKYDRAKFAGEDKILIPNANTPEQVINLTDDVLRVIFYDLVHDSVVNKNEYEEFKNKFIEEFNDTNFGFKTSGGGTGRIVEYKTWVGAGSASKSFARYGTILSPTKGQASNGKIVAVHIKDKQYPALFKTLGDLSQFMYAAKYNTMVGSGDKMGIALGLYVNAKNRKIIKCMMEDAVSGFIIYTGMKAGDLQFISKTGCGGPRNRASVCLGRVGQSINIDTLKKQIIDSLSPQKRNVAIQIKQNRVKKQLAINMKQNAPAERVTRGISNRNRRALARENVKRAVNNAKQKANIVIKTPTPKPNNSSMSVNNSAKRRNSLTRYITNLNSQLEQHSIPNRLNKTVYMNNLAKSNTDNNLNRIKQKALNNFRLVAVKNGFKKTMRNRPYYRNLTNSNKNMLNGLIKGASSINKLETNIGPFINETAKKRQVSN